MKLSSRSLRGGLATTISFRCFGYGYSSRFIQCRRRLSDKRLDNLGSFDLSYSVSSYGCDEPFVWGFKRSKSGIWGYLVGVVLSIWLADIRIAIASGTAFLTAQLIDIFVFNRVSKKTWWQAPFISSSLSSAIDTALFFSIAFVGSGLPWITWALGDYAIKLAMAVLLLIPFKLVISLIASQTTATPGNTTT